MSKDEKKLDLLIKILEVLYRTFRNKLPAIVQKEVDETFAKIRELA
ncbi:MAG: hypothetical protein SFU98_21605 [Leptospiraceae bacterium]|nr:hypothetical protein [Leptospiraceae bacterium]